MGKASDKAGKAIGKVRGGAKRALRGFHGIFQTLAEDHGEVDVLIKRTKASSDPSTRSELLAKIRSELLAHAAAEEQEFYPVLREHPETRSQATHSVEEHDQVKSMLERLVTMDPASEAWTREFDRLQNAVDHHVEEEENEIFPRAQEVLDDARVEEMDARFKRAKKASLSHPH